MRLRRVNPIQQRTRNPFLVFRNHRSRKGTGFLAVPIISTGTGIHRGDQVKIRRKRQRSFRAANGDHLIFHRLAHHFEDARTKLGKLIQKQNAAMGAVIHTNGNIGATDSPTARSKLTKLPRMGRVARRVRSQLQTQPAAQHPRHFRASQFSLASFRLMIA